MTGVGDLPAPPRSALTNWLDQALLPGPFCDLVWADLVNIAGRPLQRIICAGSLAEQVFEYQSLLSVVHSVAPRSCKWTSVPLAPREAPERDQSDQHDDEAD
jgi:hypothetical protein